MELSRIVSDFRRPGSLEELDALLADPPAGARILAGGTDLMVRLRAGREGPEPVCLVSLGGISELRGFGTDSEGRMVIGAAVSLASLSDCPVSAFRDSIREAARSVAGPSIRSTATVGGNVCNASPSADLAVALLAADSEAVLRLPGGRESRIPLSEFFLGPGRTALPPGAILWNFRIPPPSRGLRTGFRKLGLRTVMEIAVVNLAWEIEMDGSGACSAARIALGAVAPTPIRAAEAEKVLGGIVPGTKEWAAAAVEAGRRAASAAKPITDQRATAEYRTAMVESLLADELIRMGGKSESRREGA